MARPRNADIVWSHLPEMGGEALQVQKLTTKVPLTIHQVTQALQILKKEGRAINPHGKRTNYWTRFEPVIEPAPPIPTPAEAWSPLTPPTPAPAQGDVDARVHEVERHLARIEGALAGMSSRLTEVLELQKLVQAETAYRKDSPTTQAILDLVLLLGSELGGGELEGKMRELHVHRLVANLATPEPA